VRGPARDVAADSGSIRFSGRDIAGWPTHRVARLGIARSYQKTNIFPELTVERNVWLAAHSKHGKGFGLWQPADRHQETKSRADQALALVELDHRRQTHASGLSHGEQRQLELALMLAAAPVVLLLDEPMAGMSADETRRMVGLLNRLKGRCTLLLIEHDMDAVFAVADTITVMVNGSVLQTGAPEAIRTSERVKTAYLGDAA
jgi:branched-chain amino acid transport system ATP-binding protein